LFITVAVDYECDFETSDCTWNTDSTNGYKWDRLIAMIYSQSTGPNWDHTTGSCMFAISKKNRRFLQFILLTIVKMYEMSHISH
jgi:hypothetical protein